MLAHIQHSTKTIDANFFSVYISTLMMYSFLFLRRICNLFCIIVLHFDCPVIIMLTYMVSVYFHYVKAILLLKVAGIMQYFKCVLLLFKLILFYCFCFESVQCKIKVNDFGQDS